MKTTFTLTLLALTIQAMVNGQTPGNQIRKIRMDLNGATATITDEQANASGTSYTQQLEDQLKESDNLKNEEQKLKDEITATQQKLISKQIAISRIKSRLVQETYTTNNLNIENLLKEPSLKPAIIQKGEVLAREAAYAIKLAKDMREEADAQFTPQAQLAEMSNAEEKENLALAKQQEAISLLKKATPLFIKNTLEFTAQSAVQKQTAPSATTDDLTELASEAANIKTTYEALRASAVQKTGNEKAVVLNEALEMEQEYIAKQIELCMLRYKRTGKTFQENKQFINLLMASIDNEAITQKAEQLNNEADYNFRLAQEMREEANAQFTPTARLGEMSNAEEKEVIAISKQQQTVTELKKFSKSMSLAVN
jgi:hypothetical protein